MLKRFSRVTISALMVAFLIVCVPLAYLNYLANLTSRETAALRKLEEDGFLGRALYEHQYRPNYLSEYDPGAEPPSTWAARLWGEKAFIRVQVLNLRGDFESAKTLGIHAFERLERLSLSSPCLKNLSGLDRNNKLTHVSLGGTRFLTSRDIDDFLTRKPLIRELNIATCSIKKLELTNASHLESLELFEVKELRELNCHQSCPELNWISIEYCPAITSVIVSDAPRLDTLRVDTCPGLTSFKLDGVPNLQEIEIDQSFFEVDDRATFTVPRIDD